MAIEVVAISGKGGLNEFVRLPWSIYGNDPNWVPPLEIAVKELLDKAKHPFYANAEAEFFIARRDGRAVGRIAAIIDRNHNKFHEEKAGFFGFFESVDDLEVAKALLATARQWVAARGADLCCWRQQRRRVRFFRQPAARFCRGRCGGIANYPY